MVLESLILSRAPEVHQTWASPIQAFGKYLVSTCLEPSAMIGAGRWNSVRLGHTVQTEGQEDRDDSMPPWTQGLGDMSGLLWLYGIVVGLIL